jgi:hypothetical protein
MSLLGIDGKAVSHHGLGRDIWNNSFDDIQYILYVSQFYKSVFLHTDWPIALLLGRIDISLRVATYKDFHPVLLPPNFPTKNVSNIASGF